MSRLTRQAQDEKLLAEARLCLQVGYFAGALQRARRLEDHPDLRLSARLIGWIARVYSGENRWAAEALTMRDITNALRELAGGQGLAEYVLTATTANATAATAGIEAVLRAADAQHGVLVTWQPTAVLGLATRALERKDRRSAIFLTSIALGFRSVLSHWRMWRDWRLC